MDTVFLQGLTCQCVIGVWEWERHVKQKLVLDIELGTDISAAAKSDQLDDALNYQRVAERVTEVAEASEYKLLESLIDRIAHTILEEFDVETVKISLDKGSAVANVKNVGITIERTR